MFKETGRITKVENDHVWVETVRSSSCESCSAKNACGQRVLNQLHPGRCHKIRVPLGDYQQIPSEGDIVGLILPEAELVKGALTLYLLPLALLLLGAVLGGALLDSEFVVILGAVLGFCAGLWLVRKSTQRSSFKEGMQPHLIIGNGADHNS